MESVAGKNKMAGKTETGEKKKKTSKWIEHCKEQSKKLGITYAQAITDERVKKSYKSDKEKK